MVRYRFLGILVLALLGYRSYVSIVGQVHSPRFEGSKGNPLMGRYQSDPSQENGCLCKYFKQMKLKAGKLLYGGQKRSEATTGW